MTTIETLQLLLNKIHVPNREAHRSYGIMNNLLSGSILVNAGYEVFLYVAGADISYNVKVIIKGWQEIPTRLWRMPFLPDRSNTSIPPNSNIIDESSTPEIPTLLTNSIFECDRTDQLIQYYHATMGYPVISTWCKSITAGYFRGWPRLTSSRVRRHIKFATEIEMSHMDQQRQGTRSKKQTAITKK